MPINKRTHAAVDLVIKAVPVDIEISRLVHALNKIPDLFTIASCQDLNGEGKEAIISFMCLDLGVVESVAGTFGRYIRLHTNQEAPPWHMTVKREDLQHVTMIAEDAFLRK